MICLCQYHVFISVPYRLYDYFLQSVRGKVLCMETGNHFKSLAILFKSPTVWMHMISNLKELQL